MLQNEEIDLKFHHGELSGDISSHLCSEIIIIENWFGHEYEQFSLVLHSYSCDIIGIAYWFGHQYEQLYQCFILTFAENNSWNKNEIKDALFYYEYSKRWVNIDWNPKN